MEQAKDSFNSRLIVLTLFFKVFFTINIENMLL
jgi:hypothetical protein